MIFFLPFCLLFLDVDVDAMVAVDVDAVDTIEADAMHADTMDADSVDVDAWTTAPCVQDDLCDHRHPF